MSALDRLRAIQAEADDESRPFLALSNLSTLHHALPALITLLEAADKCVHGDLTTRILSRADYASAEAAFARALGESDASHPQGGEKS